MLSFLQGFVELEELTCGTDNEMQWKERARWIKFEEDVEKNEQWGKPHIASLSFHSLLELRKGIESGMYGFGAMVLIFHIFRKLGVKFDYFFF